MLKGYFKSRYPAVCGLETPYGEEQLDQNGYISLSEHANNIFSHDHLCIFSGLHQAFPHSLKPLSLQLKDIPLLNVSHS